MCRILIILGVFFSLEANANFTCYSGEAKALPSEITIDVDSEILKIEELNFLMRRQKDDATMKFVDDSKNWKKYAIWSYISPVDITSGQLDLTTGDQTVRYTCDMDVAWQ
jgi:hypothetical protein